MSIYFLQFVIFINFYYLYHVYSSLFSMCVFSKSPLVCLCENCQGMWAESKWSPVFCPMAYCGLFSC